MTDFVGWKKLKINPMLPKSLKKLMRSNFGKIILFVIENIWVLRYQYYFERLRPIYYCILDYVQKERFSFLAFHCSPTKFKLLNRTLLKDSGALGFYKFLIIPIEARIS